MKFVLSAVTKHTKASTIVIILADIFYFIISDPYHSSVLFMVFGFALLGISIYLICRLIAGIMSASGLFKVPKGWAVAAASLFIYLMLTLQAIGQLSLRDITVLAPLAAIAYFYFTRISTSKPSDS